jgi:hypothetical protein
MVTADAVLHRRPCSLWLCRHGERERNPCGEQVPFPFSRTTKCFDSFGTSHSEFVPSFTNRQLRPCPPPRMGKPYWHSTGTTRARRRSELDPREKRAANQIFHPSVKCETKTVPNAKDLFLVPIVVQRRCRQKNCCWSFVVTSHWPQKHLCSLACGAWPNPASS